MHAATASPLRRRASAKMAARSGFALGEGGSGSGSMGLGISPPRTTTALSGNVAAFSTSALEGVGEEFGEGIENEMGL